jgi:hypothetical protein
MVEKAHVRVRGAQVSINLDTEVPHFKTGLLSQLYVGAYTYGQKDHLAGDFRAAVRHHLFYPVLTLKTRHPLAKKKTYAPIFKDLDKREGHVFIEQSGQRPAQFFYYGDLLSSPENRFQTF